MCALQRADEAEISAECSLINGPLRVRGKMDCSIEYLKRKSALTIGNVLAFSFEWAMIKL